MPLVQTAITGFCEYPKIDTLFERDERFIVDTSKIKKPVLATIGQWDVTEKIDGTNIRIMLGEDGKVQVGGRTQNAQLPADLLTTLMQQFSEERMQKAFFFDAKPGRTAILFGEGYGAGIQKGGSYRPDKAFILFDVLVDGRWWLDREDVLDVASKLGADTVPYLGRWTLDQITAAVAAGMASAIGTGPAEGIVARPIQTLFDSRMDRIIIKLKTKDFGKK